MAELMQIRSEGLIEEVEGLKAKGARLVQIMCSMIDEGYELTYNFDIEGALVNLRLVAPQGGAVESITKVFLYAFIWENEIHDLFGLEFLNMVPEFDYKGKFFHLSTPTPWNPAAQVAVPKGLGIDASIKNEGGAQNG